MTPPGTPDLSIRRRLLVLLLGAVTLTWALATAATYVDTHREVDRLLDAHLAQATAVLAAQAGHELLEIETGDLLEPGDYGQSVTFQVWQDDGQLLVKSADAPGVRLSQAESGFADTWVADRQWRVFTLRDPRYEVLIEVAEDHAIRNRIAARVAFNALLPLGIALPVLGLLIGWSVRRALRPLEVLGEQVRGRNPLALEPLELAEAPLETAPLVERLNDLFTRIRNTTELERRFTADAAHELRKPVAAVRAQAELARTTQDAAMRDNALDNVERACDRMGSLMEQLLTLARLDQDSTGLSLEPQDLAAIVRATMADMAPAALVEYATEIGLEVSGDTRIEGQAPLLDTLARNLISNALRHGGGEVRVRVDDDGAHVTLSVSDTGAGVPAGERARLGERFFRGQAMTPGSGLGLSIVRRISDLHHAQLTFSTGPAGKGLEVRVAFPRLRRLEA